MGISRKELAIKLAAHEFTVVTETTGDDRDVQEFKARETARKMQAKQRAERAKTHKEEKDKSLRIKTNPNHKKFNTTLACKLHGLKIK